MLFCLPVRDDATSLIAAMILGDKLPATCADDKGKRARPLKSNGRMAWHEYGRGIGHANKGNT
jgi:hypothetical protein